jgi:ribosomal protein L40E
VSDEKMCPAGQMRCHCHADRVCFARAGAVVALTEFEQCPWPSRQRPTCEERAAQANPIRTWVCDACHTDNPPDSNRCRLTVRCAGKPPDGACPWGEVVPFTTEDGEETHVAAKPNWREGA